MLRGIICWFTGRHDWRFSDMTIGGYHERCRRCGLDQYIPQ